MGGLYPAVAEIGRRERKRAEGGGRGGEGRGGGTRGRGERSGKGRPSATLELVRATCAEIRRVHTVGARAIYGVFLP